MKDELVSKVMDEVMKKMGISEPACAPEESCCAQPAPACNLTEFVGTAWATPSAWSLPTWTIRFMSS